MARQVALFVALIGSVAWMVGQGPAISAQTSRPPSVQIANGAVTATVYLPDAVTGYYRGTRSATGQ